MRQSFAVAAVATALVAGPLVSSAQAVSPCVVSAGSTLCLTVPDGALSGDVTISADWASTKSATVEFTLDGAYLNFEYQRPYSFTWPTGKEVDGRHVLAARVHKGSTYGVSVSTTVDLRNGNATAAGIPRTRADYATLFSPQPGGVLAAVGNAGAEKPDEKRLLSYIQSTAPSALLYLGEVHEYGSWATRLDHYGRASFDDPSGKGTLWGAMARYTLATQGNHERDYITEYEDYWHQRPLWSTTVVDGIRIYDLTSECKANGGCLSKGAQYTWLSNQLSSNTEHCVVAMWHRPLVSQDKKRSGGTYMLPTWAALAAHGGDLVLNADTRDMEEVAPMNGSLATGQPDSHMVELVSGAAAARWVANVTADSRVDWRVYRVPGAVFVSRSGDTLSWQFRDASGAVLRTGSVACT